MPLLNDIHHLTFITADLDRLIGFYERIFEARVTVDLEEEGLRHAFIEVGPHTVLHPFEVPGVEPPSSQPMFQRGRLDHFAFWAPSKESFCELRRRIESEAAADGDVRDMNTMLIMGFHDPDGFYVEVIWRKPGLPDAETLPRAAWTTVAL